MRILLVVTSANDVFIYNLAKWLKKSLDCSLDAFELFSSTTANQENSDGLFETVETANWQSWWGNNKLTRFVLSPIMIARQLDRFVSDKHYDIIHVHGIWFYVPFTKKLKLFTEKLFISFWGEEFIDGKVWKSHAIFNRKLKAFIRNVDGITGTKARFDVYHRLYPNTKLYQAKLGAASMERLLYLNQTQSKEDSKRYWQIPTGKITILIGYSGKRLHNHLGIISEFNKHPELADKVHILAPMTRGADAVYVKEVESALETSLFSYTLLKDCFLSDEDIAQLRYATDFVFQFASSDAYSRSIIECICAGAILIYGDWIKYDKFLADDNYKAIVVKTINQGIEIVEDYIKSREKYHLICNENIQSGGIKFLWSECIKDWVDIYTGKKNAEVF